MGKSKDGGPAFAFSHFQTPDGMVATTTQEGMSLRDWFAGQALIAVVGNNQLLDEMSDSRSDKDFAVSVSSSCYRLADAMLTAREASEPGE